jgi:hypothetical protein
MRAASRAQIGLSVINATRPGALCEDEKVPPNVLHPHTSFIRRWFIGPLVMTLLRPAIMSYGN